MIGIIARPMPTARSTNTQIDVRVQVSRVTS